MGVYLEPKGSLDDNPFGRPTGGIVTAAIWDREIERNKMGIRPTRPPRPVIKPIKCEYCGQQSPASALECRKCGAPLPDTIPIDTLGHDEFEGDVFLR